MTPPESRRLRVVTWLAVVALAAAVWINTAWIADDAYITFRSVDNLWRGFGPRWNVIERVQPYTHPLWFLLLAIGHGLGPSLYTVALALSLACTALTGWLIASRVASSTPVAVFGVVALTSSCAFAQFSSSGLENPLTAVLLVLFWIACWRGAPGRAQTFHLTLLLSLCWLTRPDSVVLILPAWALSLWAVRGPSRAGPILAGLAPIIAWETFSLVYYGRPLPNSAYAKLGGGIPGGEMVMQGLRYLADSALRDYVTLPAVAAAVCLAMTRGAAGLAVAAGMLLELAYIVRAGGDFMSGRFLTGVFVSAIAFLCDAVTVPRRAFWLVPAAVALVSLASPASPLRLWQRPAPGDPLVERFAGIVDERTFYYPFTGLIPVLGGKDPSQQPWADAGRQWRGSRGVIAFEAVGLMGFYGGPAVHVIDTVGIADPLLAQLPTTDRVWRPGHLHRAIPEGYENGLRECLAHVLPRVARAPVPESCLDVPRTNQIADRAIAATYDDIQVITQGPIFTWRRARLVAASLF